MIETTQYANNVFEQPWWLNIVAPGKWKEILISRDEKVVARLPYVVESGKIKPPPYTQTLGIWVDESFCKEKRGNEHLGQTKEIFKEIVDSLPYKNMDFTFDSSVRYILPFRWLGFNIEPTFSYRISNLDKLSEKEQLFSKNVKRDINRGKKKLVIESENASVKDFIKLQNLTYARQNRKNPVENRETEKIITESIALGHGKLFIAKDDMGAPHAGSFVLFDEKVCYHLMSGQDVSYGNDCAMPWLMYNEILFAARVSKAFDFEGSMIEGIEQVYRRYGGEQIINWHVSKQNIVNDLKRLMKPYVKRMIGYKI